MTDVNIDALDALHAKATAGEWASVASDPSDGFECYWLRVAVPFAAPMRGMRIVEIGSVNGPQSDEQAANAASIVALHNAWPAVSAELRALRERVKVLELAANRTEVMLRPPWSSMDVDAAHRIIRTALKGRTDD